MTSATETANQGSERRRWRSFHAQESRLAWLLILPTAIIVFGLVLFPAIFSIWISFHDVGLGNLSDVFHAPFVGFENYRSVFNDFAFKFQGMQSWGAAVTSIVYSFAGTILTLVTGLIASLLLNGSFERGVWRGRSFSFPTWRPSLAWPSSGAGFWIPAPLAC